MTENSIPELQSPVGITVLNVTVVSL